MFLVEVKNLGFQGLITYSIQWHLATDTGFQKLLFKLSLVFPGRPDALRIFSFICNMTIILQLCHVEIQYGVFVFYNVIKYCVEIKMQKNTAFSPHARLAVIHCTCMLLFIFIVSEINNILVFCDMTYKINLFCKIFKH